MIIDTKEGQKTKKNRAQNKGGIIFFCLIYNNHLEVFKFLEDLLHSNRSDLDHIIVTDNSDKIKSPNNEPSESIKEAISEGKISIFGDGVNRGYFGGFRYGLSHASKIIRDSASWFVFSNTDLKIETADWTRKLIEIDQDEVFVVAPDIVSKRSHKHQNPFYKKRPNPSKFLLLSRIFQYNYLTAAHRVGALLFAKASSAPKPAPNNSYIYAAHGSFFCVSRSYFENGGNLSCPTFLFCEEIFLAEEIRQMQKKILYTREIKIVHEEHKSTSLIPPPPIREHLQKAHQMAYLSLSK